MNEMLLNTLLHQERKYTTHVIKLSNNCKVLTITAIVLLLNQTRLERKIEKLEIQLKQIREE